MTPPTEMTPTVDVIIPTYNQAAFLHDALQSVAAQDFSNWNALVINNMSTDDTQTVVDSFKEPRISMLDFSNDGIIAASRNLGIFRSSAKYIAFLDSDDWWFPHKLRRCVEQLETGFDLVCHAEEWKRGASSRHVSYGPECRAEYRTLLLRGNCLSTSAVMGRTSMFQQVGGFSTNPEFTTAEDYDLWLRLAERRYNFTFLDETLGVFRVHSMSASSSVDRNFRAEMSVVQDHLSQLENASSLMIRKRKARSHYGAARAHHRNGNLKSARIHYGKAFGLWPVSLRILAGTFLLLCSVARQKGSSGPRP
jgi:glycosyltransferase involved in cell wall biosynthesis